MEYRRPKPSRGIAQCWGLSAVLWNFCFIYICWCMCTIRHEIATESWWRRIWKVLDDTTHHDALQLHFTAYTLFSHYPSWLLREPCGVGVLCHVPVPWLSLPSGPPVKKSQLRGGQARTPACWPWMRPEGQVLEWRLHLRRVFLLERRFGVIWDPCLGGRESCHNYFYSLLLLQIARGVFLELDSSCLCCI